jgi:hypothetical protein
MKMEKLESCLQKLSITCPKDIISGNKLDAKTRTKIFGNVAGGANSQSPEKYQRKKIEEGMGIKCDKTNMRINIRTSKLVEISRPNINDDGFDYTENFDGIQKIDDKTLYYNFKCVVGKGGSQTRSLREVYWFMYGQMNVLKDLEKIYFINILDGDEASNVMNKFKYLINELNLSESQLNQIYVGDLKNYFDWIDSRL